MSRSDKDKPGGHLRRNSDRLDCGCCTSLSRDLFSRERTIRERTAMEFEELTEGDAEEMFSFDPREQHGHQFFARRCLRCNLRELDLILSGDPEPCPVSVEDDPVFYTTTSEGIAALSHPII